MRYFKGVYVGLTAFLQYLRQLASSDPSLQSRLLSHLRDSGIHLRSDTHWNSPDAQSANRKKRFVITFSGGVFFSHSLNPIALKTDKILNGKKIHRVPAILSAIGLKKIANRKTGLCNTIFR